jgi:hypothetical protein
MPRRSRTVATLLAATLLLGAAACGDDDDDEAADGAGPASTTPTTAPSAPGTAAAPPADPAATEAFCARVRSEPDEVPESYMGSPEHLVLVGEYLALAPEEIRADVEAFHDFLVEGGITPEDPDSNLVENFPPPVRQASLAIVDYTDRHC